MMECNFLLECKIKCCLLRTQPAHTGKAFAVQCVLALLWDSVGEQNATNQLQYVAILSSLSDFILRRDVREE